jgi:hypothetical protein
VKLEKPGDGESKARYLLCAGWQLRDAVYRCAGGRLVQAPEDWHVRGAKPSGVTAGLGARRRPPYAQAGGEEPTHGTNDQIPSHPVHALYVRSHVDLPFRPHRKGCDGGAQSIRVFIGCRRESAGPIPDFARRHRSTCQYRSDNRKLTRGQGGRVQCFDAQFY